MTLESGFFQRLSENALACIQDPEGAISFRMPDDLRMADEDFAHLVEDIRRRIQKIGLPPEIAHNGFYRLLVTETLTPEDITKIKNILPFIPNKLDRESIESNVRRMADDVVRREVDGLTQAEVIRAITATRNILIFNLGKNLKLIDDAKIIRTDLLTKDKEPVSTKRIRQVISIIKEKIEKGEVDRSNANIALLKELDLIDKEVELSEKDVEKLEDDIRSCLRKGWKFYEEIGKTLAKSQAEFGIGGEQIKIDPSFITKGKNLFELLELATDPLENRNKTGAELLKYHEAQTAAWLGYLFFHIESQASYKVAKKLQEAFRLAIGSKLFKDIDELIPENVYMDHKRNIIQGPDMMGEEIYTPYQTRKLTVRRDDDQEVEMRVWFDDVRTKTEEAIIRRLITSPDFNFENIPDIIGGRLVLMDLKRNDLLHLPEDEEETKAEKNNRIGDLEKIARKIGNSIGLSHEYVDRESLEPGQFCISNKLKDNPKNEKSEEYFSYKIYGKTKDGVRFEFQIIPRDVFENMNSAESPNNHEFYDMEKDFRVATAVFRQSSSPRIHEVANQARGKLSERKTRAREAK